MKKPLHNTAAFTLIEISLVLGLALALMVTLFWGLQAYNSHTERARCIINMSNAQKAMRSLMSMYEFRPGDTFTVGNTGLQGTLVDNVFGESQFISQSFEDFQCPTARKQYGGGANSFPDMGVMWLVCPNNPQHQVKDPANM